MSEIFDDVNLKLVTDLIRKGDISGWFNSHDGGPYLQKFQNKFAEACNAKHAYAVSSGSAAIYIALRACGVGPGDFVAVPTYTHIGSVAPIVLAGAEPLFVDCDRYGNMDGYELHSKILKHKDSGKIKAVIVVHQLGQPCNMQRLKLVAGDKYIIEDASHALGAEYFGEKAGTLGDVGCFSVGGGRTKIFGTGEGGVAVTNSDEIAEKIKNLRNHGDRVSDFPEFCFNFRMSELNALIGLMGIEKLDMLLKWQIENAEYLSKNRPDFLVPPTIPVGCKSTRYLVNCNFNEEKAGMTRDQFLAKLKEKGWAGGVPRKNISGGYSKLVSDIQFYHKWSEGKYLVSERLRDNSIWIDWHRFNRTKEEIDQLVNTMKEIV